MESDFSNLLWEKSELLEATKGKDLSKKFLLSNQVTGISIDTRTLNKGDLFIALLGENYDGNDFLEDALKKGASGIITSNKQLAKKTFGLYVENTNQAFKRLAMFARERFNGKVIAITGSNGKTSTKNMISSILHSFEKTHSTFNNNNNLIGLCLTLSRLKKNYKYCVLELGMSKKKELKTLSELSSPNMILVTNISSSHIGNFKSEEEIALEKSNIFFGLTKNGKIVLNADDKWFYYLKTKAFSYTNNVVSFGTKDESEMRIKKILTTENGTTIKFNDFNLNFKSLPKHYAINIAGILLVMKSLNLNLNNILNKINNFQPTQGRGNSFEICIKKNEYARIIDDSYNANPASMKVALENIYEIKKRKPNINVVLVIGDMLELGKNTEAFHKKLIKKIQLIKPRCLITIGKHSRIIAKKLKKCFACESFDNIDQFKNNFFFIIQHQDVILIKGSNGIGLFKFTQQLYNNIYCRS